MDRVDSGRAAGRVVSAARELREALRSLLLAIDDETTERDGRRPLPVDDGCIRCTSGVADSGLLCAYHAAERALEATR